MTQQLKFDVFISYRRDGGEIMGRLLYEMLKDNFNVFFDHESLSSGRFDKKLLDIISSCNDVIVILSKDCLHRCKNEGDWFRQEINCAIENNKNIILLMMDGFEIPSNEELLSYPLEIRNLVKYNGYKVSVAYLDNVISKLVHDMVTKKKQAVSPVDSISEWNMFSRCLLDNNYTSILPKDLKREILYNSITAFFDEYKAKILSSVVDRMLKTNNNVRTKFRYEIDIESEFDFKVSDIDSSKYYQLSESLSYSKKFMSGSPDRTFLISFATNLDELDSHLRNENIFFRENLLMDKQDIIKLSMLDKEDKNDFYLNNMRCKININGEVLKPEMIVIDESGIHAKYSLSEELLNKSVTFDVKIRFKIPQINKDGYFFACISEPTFAPFIRFSYPEDEFNIDMIPFLNRSLTAKETKVFEGLREVNIEDEWVIPVSGAIFLINKL